MSHLPLFEKPKRQPSEPAKRSSERPSEEQKPRRSASKGRTGSSSSAKKKKSTARKQVNRLEERGSLADLVRRGDLLIRFVNRYGLYLVIGALALSVVILIVRANSRPNSLPALFTPEVRYWQSQILDWSARYGVDPNVVATIMQIESCGYPGAASGAGAQGLFQVMPFNFESTVSNQLDPNENAKAGLKVISDCLRYANNDVGLALACYNGGPGLISRPMSQWPAESQRYYTWGTGIYADAVRHASSSDALTEWLNAGGIGLCERAAVALGMSTRAPNVPTLIPPPSALPTFNTG